VLDGEIMATVVDLLSPFFFLQDTDHTRHFIKQGLSMSVVPHFTCMIGEKMPPTLQSTGDPVVSSLSDILLFFFVNNNSRWS